MYKIIYAKTFEKDIKKLDKAIIKRIFDKISEATKNPKILKPLKYSPKNLQKLTKLRVGDWRILFWLDHKTKTITLYTVEHRSKIYSNL